MRRLFAIGVACAMMLVGFVDVGSASAAAAPAARSQPASANPTLSRGDRGPAVGYLQAGLTAAKFPTPIDGIYGRHTQRTVARFQAVYGLKVTGKANPPTVRALGRVLAAQIPTFTDLCVEMNWHRERVGLPYRFADYGRHQTWVASDGLGWREAKCRNDLTSSTGCCVGWWQLNIGLFLRDHRMAPRLHACGVWSKWDALGTSFDAKSRQACAAKALYDVAGLSPWRPL